MILTRFVLVRRGCPFCLMAKKAVTFLNRHCPDYKQIRILDNFEWEEFGFKAHPIIDKLDPKTFDGYPYIYIDGIEIEPAEENILKITIGKIIEEDLIIPVRIGDIQLGARHDI